MKNLHHACAALALVLASASGHAAIVDIQWSPDGRFEHKASVAPGKFVELCGKLALGSRVRWSFEGTAATNFNIHYHVGKDVVYPAKKDQVQREQGELRVEADQDYCWMWSNKSGAALDLRVTLAR